MKGLLLRSASGIVYVAIIVLGLVISDTFFKIFMCLFAALGIIEFIKLTNQHPSPITMLLDVAGGIIGILGLYALASGAGSAATFGALYLAYILMRLVTQLYLRGEKDSLSSLAHSYMSQMYVMLPIGLMSMIWCRPGYGGQVLLAMFIMIWLNDTGAFCVGSTLGRHKLFPRISPKKSWEGFVGGVVFAIASAFIFKYCFGSLYEQMSLMQMLIMGAVVGVFATWGDLVESLIKRTLGVKDSGNLIPGHGGILDRIDSLLLVVPALLVYLWIIG